MLIIEGIDGVGKTTIVEYLCKEEGFKKCHFDYDIKNLNLKEKYLKVLTFESLENLVLDRSFISEMVYGPVIRNKCKLTFNEYIDLLKEYKKCGAKIIYLTAPKQVLLNRRIYDSEDYIMINKYYEELDKHYEKIMNISQDYTEITKYDTFLNNEIDVQEKVRKLIR